MRFLTLPYPPTVNHYYKPGHYGRRFIGPPGLAFRAAALLTVRKLRAPTLTGHLRVTVDVHPPDRRTRDLGNLDKCLMDALTHAGLWEDDSLIDDQRFRRRAVCPGAGRVEVYVSEIDVEPHVVPE